MKRAIAGLLAVTALAAGAGRAGAQGTLPVSVEARLDAGLPIGDFKDAAKAGLGWGVTGAFDVSPNFAIYAGYSSFDFDVKSSTLTVRDDGFDVGGRVLLGTGGGVMTTYAQFGALFHNDDTGFEAGLGAEYQVGPAVTLTPLARYRKIGDIQYVGLGVGLSLRP
jgi:opacity protein-like surface antigen